MYFHGAGVDRDYLAALAWFQKSAEQGSGEAQAWLGHMVEKGLGVEPDIQKALELFRKSAAQDNALGQVRLGDLYLNGLGVDANPRKALACYQKSAEQSRDPESAGLAQLRLGAMYCQGKGVEKDLKKGFEFYLQSAWLGNAEAQLCLGAMYRDGVGVGRDHKKALEWFQKSARKNKVPAASAMGDLYRDGLVVEKNIPEAMRWYKKAAAVGDKYAKTELLRLQQAESAPKESGTDSAPAAKSDLQATADAAPGGPSGRGVEKMEGKPLEPLAKAAEKRIACAPGPLPQARQPRSAKQQIEDKTPEGTSQGPVPEKARRTGKAPIPRTSLYLFSFIGMIALSLMIAFLASRKRTGDALASLELGALEIHALPRPESRSIPPMILEPARDILKRIRAQKSSPALGDQSSPPIAESGHAAVAIEPVVPLLRREYRSLDEGEIAEMLTAKNMFDAKRNSGGGGPHRYEVQNAAGLRLIFDRATNLVWTRQQNLVKMNLEKSIQWIESLNRVEYGGIRHWRLPTVEEAASLLKKNAGNGDGFLDAIFGEDVRVIWTGDSLVKSESWVVDFQNGTIKSAKSKSRLITLMVSSDSGSFGSKIPNQGAPASDN
jgi:TPR repeat protein